MKDREFYFLAEAYSRVNTKVNENLQQVRLGTDTAMKTLIANVFNDPNPGAKFWEVLKKMPGLYGALLANNQQKAREIFLSFGVDLNKINDTVAKSMELFQQYQRGTPVEVRRATKVPTAYDLAKPVEVRKGVRVQ